MPSIIWFREDLRIHDNTALIAARNQSEHLVAVYFITPKTWRSHDLAATRINFMLQGLALLQKNLDSLHIPLLVFQCPKFSDIDPILCQVAEHYKATHVFANKQYEVNELARDVSVEKALAKINIKFHTYDDQTIIAPDKIKTQKNTVYTVFTPYKKAWINTFIEEPPIVLKVPKKAKKNDAPEFKHNTLLTDIPEKIPGFTSTVDVKLWPAGEKIALKQLDKFVSTKIKKYEKERDFPALDGTSQISPYLATGMLSARMCLEKALKANKGKLIDGNKNIDCWISELIWREFYKSILVGFPRVCRHRAFQLDTEKLKWHSNHDHLVAWKNGKTGFPIVDAAMRQLKQTGWMHNRLRMITAMFFSKLLWIDWRLGEQYFMQHLIDGDFASNNGGWQWSASTGTDAAPYFRIFNPISQSEKFDPKGEFIRQYCPELADLDDNAIHNPYEYAIGELDYPQPIIDYKKCREYAIETFKKLKS